MPTDAEKSGNFSQILSADATILYNPYTAVTTGTTVTRQPYAGNIIPASQINPIAMAYLKYIPNRGRIRLRDGFDNLGINATSNDHYNT